jgi:glycosyltransferase involved in cell wall biosynthesis
VKVDQPIPVLHPITRLIVGGAQENTLYSAERLDKKLFQVEVLSGVQTGSEGSLIEEACQKQIPLILLPELRREINPVLDWIALDKIKKLLNERSYVIVHTHSSKAGILGRIAARQANIPIIIHSVHGWSFHPQMDPVRKYIYIFLEKKIARFTDALIFVSQKDLQKGIAYKITTPEKAHLIRSAIPLEEFTPHLYDRDQIRNELNIPKQSVVIGNVGRLSTQKNPLGWIRVAELVSRQSPECFFLMVGDGPLRRQVEMEIKKTGLENKIILTGIRRDIPRMLACMDIFLLTSLWEGLPRAIPQAYAMGIPVISHQIDGITDIVIPGESGFTQPPGEYELLARDCLELLNNPGLRKSLGKTGQQRVKDEFSLDVMISQISDLYLKILEKK